MSDDTSKTTETAPEKPSSPPWGSEENFDAARAWNLIENLRNEVVEVKGERDTAKGEVETLSKRAVDAEKAAESASAELSTIVRQTLLDSLKAEHELDDDIVDEFLTKDLDEEQLRAKAARLASLGKPKAEEPKAPEADADADLPARPKPALTPGHGGDEPEPFDPKAIALAARNGN